MRINGETDRKKGHQRKFDKNKDQKHADLECCKGKYEEQASH